MKCFLYIFIRYKFGKLYLHRRQIVSTKGSLVLNLATKVVTFIPVLKFMALGVNYVLKDYLPNLRFSTNSIMAPHVSIDLNWNHVDF